MNQLIDHLSKAWKCLGNQQYQQAISHADAAKLLNPKLPEIYFIRIQSKLLLGVIDNDLLDECKEALKLFENHPELITTYSQVDFEINRNFERALQAVEQSIRIKDTYANSWVHKSYLLYSNGRYDECIKAAEEALKIQPKNTSALINMAASLKELGCVEEAIRICKLSIESEPNNTLAWSNYLFTLLFSSETTSTTMYEVARERARHIKKRYEASPKNTRKSGEKIKIAFISNDFYRHACSYFIIPLLMHIDRKLFHVTCIYLNKIFDSVTDKYKIICDDFWDANKKTDKELIFDLRSSQFDVAFDLGGYTGRSPVNILANRVAPVQVSWLGFPATSGEKNIDYRISDEYSDLPENHCNYTEKLICFAPAFCVYQPRVQSPLDLYTSEYDIRDTPALKNGYITFGSTNNIAKITDETLKLWSVILNKISSAKLIIEAANVTSKIVSDNLAKRFLSNNIDFSRIQLVDRNIYKQYLLYHEIDILLDTTPLTGGTTTCDALWMGVPVVTKSSSFFHGRMTSTFLHACGIAELIADSDEKYISNCLKLASNLMHLNSLRSKIRNNFKNGIINKINVFSDNFNNFFSQKLKNSYENFELQDKSEIFIAGALRKDLDIRYLILQQIMGGETGRAQIFLEIYALKNFHSWIVAYFLSLIEMKNGNIKMALSYLDKSLSLCSNNENRKNLASVYKKLLSVKMDDSAINSVIFMKYRVDLSKVNIDEQSRPETVLELRK